MPFIVKRLNFGNIKSGMTHIMKKLAGKINILILVAAVCVSGVAYAELMKGEAPNFTLKSLKGVNIKL